MPSWQFPVIKGAVLLATLYGAGQLIPKQLENADFAGASLPEQHWAGARLNNADLQNADLSRSDLRGADLSSACLCRTTLTGANLAGANLRLANLCGADLSTANLTSVILQFTMYDATTRWPSGFLPFQHSGLYRRSLPTPELGRYTP